MHHQLCRLSESVVQWYGGLLTTIFAVPESRPTQPELSASPHALGSTPDATLARCVTIADIKAAAARIGSMVHRTPVHTCSTLDAMAGEKAQATVRLFFKCENFQRVGAFKFRGAANALAQLDDDARSRGVLTWSSGNHAQAIAKAAAMLGVKATIVMPTNAPKAKLDATRSYLANAPAGSDIVLYDPTTQCREALGTELAAKQSMTIIPPYDHPAVIAGAGTAALELFDQVGPLDALYVPCGGGGLLSGSAVAAAALCPACKVIGVEPTLANDATRSVYTGTLHTVTNPPTIADGARTPWIGRYPYALVSRYVAGMCTVSEEAIVHAMTSIMTRAKLVVEPTGALGLAGVLAGDWSVATQTRQAAGDQDHSQSDHANANANAPTTSKTPTTPAATPTPPTARLFAPPKLGGKRIGIILSGGNVDLSMLARLMKPERS